MNASAAESKSLKTRDGFQVGDKIIVTTTSPSLKCQLVEVTSLALTDDVTLMHEAGVPYTTLAGVTATASMNPAGGTGTTFTTGNVFDLGPTPVQSVWTVDPARHVLTRYNALLEDPAVSTVDMASDVVNFKVQYGIDVDGNGQISSAEWVNTAPAGTNWTQVLAVRFAMLVRSRQFERPDATTPKAVTPVAPTWGDGTSFVLNNIDGTSDSGAGAVGGDTAINNWRNYRYRVYEGVVPLRNMIWGTAP
jgi:type IV pilus assembly protein PilW